MVRLKKRNPLKDAVRLKTIVSVFAKHGFQNFAERAKLGRYILGKFSKIDVDKYTMAERLRMSFEQLGPTFVKFGQLLATRPDLIPKEFVDEFKKLHDQVSTVEFEKIEKVLVSHFGASVDHVFQSFEKTPIAAASIAQVYKANLKDGSPVVVKVQRPGIDDIILRDLSVLFTLAELSEKYIPELRIYNPIGIVNEFAKTLDLETNFVVEANNIRRFEKNFETEPNIKIPHVYSEYTGRRVLVMEELEGIPLSHKNALAQEGIQPEKVLKTGLRCYLKMVFTDGLFHGDLHAGNMFVLPDNKVGLIDFGVVGRLNHKTQSALANMLVALATEDYDRFAYEYLDLSPYSGHVDVDLLARDLRDLIAPYYGLTLEHINVGRLLMDSTAVAARHHLKLPTELVMFFKSIVTIEGMGRLIMKDFDFLSYSLEFAAELVQSRYEPSRVIKDLSLVGRDLNSLMTTMPRQIKQFLRRLNSPDMSLKISIQEMNELKKTMDASSKRIFLGFLIGSLIISASGLWIYNPGPKVFDLPAISLVGYILAFVLSFLVLF